MDVVLVAGMVRLALGAGVKAASYYLVSISLVLLLAADVTFGQSSLTGGASVALGQRLSGIGYTLSYVLWGAAALHPSMPTMTAPAPVREPTLSRRRLVALAAASLLGPLILGFQFLPGARFDVLLIATPSWQPAARPNPGVRCGRRSGRWTCARQPLRPPTARSRSARGRAIGARAVPA